MKLVRCCSLFAGALAAALIMQSVSGAEKTGLTVSAAASMKDALLEMKSMYESVSPNVEITFNFGSSGSLQRQIEQGAPVDLFVSASSKQMNALTLKKLTVDSTIDTVARNDLVLIVPKDSSYKGDFRSIAGSAVKRIALGETASVPAGQYALEVLNFYGIREAVAAKAVYAKDVREVLAWVETGNVDAGIVYRTDALVSKKVRIASTAPAESHSPVTYPAAVIASSRPVKEAVEFERFLSGARARAVFVKYGFAPGK